MNKKIFLIIILAAIPIIKGCNCSDAGTEEGNHLYYPSILYTSDGGNTWDKDTIAQNEFGSSGKTYFTDFTLFSGSAYCVIYNGSIWYSDVIDDFTNWQPGTSYGPFFVRFESTGFNKGYAIGFEGDTAIIYSSTNGKSWSKIHSKRDQRYGYRYIDAYDNNVIAMGDSCISYSNDFGVSWHDTTMGSAPGLFTGVCILSPVKALCVRGLQHVYFSADGGASWTLRSSLDKFGADLFVNRSSGLILINGPHDLIRSMDEGNTWTDLILPSGMNDLFVNDNICVGAGSGFYKSGDNGSTWDREIIDQSILTKVYFQDDGMFGYINATVESR